MAKKKKPAIRIVPDKPKKIVVVPVPKPKTIKRPPSGSEPVAPIVIPPKVKKGDVVMPPEPKPRNEKAKSKPVGGRERKKGKKK